MVKNFCLLGGLGQHTLPLLRDTEKLRGQVYAWGSYYKRIKKKKIDIFKKGYTEKYKKLAAHANTSIQRPRTQELLYY